MPHDEAVAQAYREVRQAERWRKERLTPRWQLAAAAATGRNLLHGPTLLKHATSPDVNPKAGGKRTVVKKLPAPQASS